MSLNTYDELAINTTPELIFGLVGPIGVDIVKVQNKLRDALTAVKYEPVEIRVTDLMQGIQTDISIVNDAGPLKYYTSRMDYANAIRKKCEDNSALAALSILAIKNFRSKTHSEIKSHPIDERKVSPLDTPLPGTAYIIRQFKTKEEITLMRAVYGKKFIQVSVHASEESRIKKIINDINLRTAGVTAEDVEITARALIKRDENEKDENEKDEVNGQRLGKIFHLGDVFVDGTSETSITKTVTRFINAFFGKNSISPTKDEYGSYIAASAALRSIDVSRQVGAAIFSKDGEIISMGSNEVPKFGGGTYWEDDTETPHRDFDDKRMPNYVRKNRMFHDILSKLRGAGYLNLDKLSNSENQSDPLTEIMKNEVFNDALIDDITEFGRMTHAEMNAITDAARLGRAVKNSTLFGTTFPCHNCAKHIVASGIDRVVFIEPYPKSQALPLNGDSITLDAREKNKVIFCNFVGISPRRYQDIFEKGKRKSKTGEFNEWFEITPAPRILDRGAGYVLNESSAILRSLSKVEDEILITEIDPDETEET